MSRNPVKQFRAKLGMKKPQFAALVGMEPSTVGAWELEPKPEQAKILADEAAKRGLHRLAHEFRVMAKLEADKAGDDPAEWSEDEKTLADGVIRLYRNPDDPIEKAAVDLLWGLLSRRDSLTFGEQLKSMSEAERSDLAKFLRNPVSRQVVHAFAAGIEVPSAFAAVENNTGKTGEDMAKGSKP